MLLSRWRRAVQPDLRLRPPRAKKPRNTRLAATDVDTATDMMPAVPPRLLSRALALALFVAAGPALAQQADQPPGIPISAEAAQRQDVPVLLRNIGAVQSYMSVLVRARVDGTLDRVLFTEGQDVHAGDKLAIIDPRPYAAALAQAQAKKSADEALLANARRDLVRYSNLARSDFASHQQVDTQNATVAQTEATIGVAAYPVQNCVDIHHDTNLEQFDFWHWLDHPEMGPTPYEGLQHRMSATPGELRSPAPLLGQHNDEIFSGMLGLSPGEIEQLKQDRVIF